MGQKSGVMVRFKRLTAVVVATSLLLPATAFATKAVGKQAERSKITVHAKRRWHGYGFLPGYRPFVNNLDRQGRSVRSARYEPRYFNWSTGQWSYGWGYPGFYHGRWNGGSFGPCWTSTPIGMMPTCGQ
jgi:hypothetical protein